MKFWQERLCGSEVYSDAMEQKNLKFYKDLADVFKAIDGGSFRRFDTALHPLKPKILTFPTDDYQVGFLNQAVRLLIYTGKEPQD